MAAMEGPLTGTIEKDLQKRFGFAQFLPGQRELITAALSGRDALGLMPTGGGKSLTYQLSALRLGGITVVVSPLIALMKDQVDAFNRRHGPRAMAVALHSGMGRAEVWQALDHVDEGRASLLYVAPERLEFSAFRERLRGLGAKLLVIDEVHCVSLWGHDFRPSYMRLAGLIRDLRPCPVLGLTSTATPQARQDILRQLGLQDPLVYLAPLDRPNLFFRVVECRDDSDKQAHVLRIVGKVGARRTQIVYVGRRADAEGVAAYLSAEGVRAAPYHAGMPAGARKDTQEAWLAGKTPVIVATVAFGMGIDNPHVRAVTHYQHPASIEGYYQEAGRAGRDRQPADCTILFSSRDMGLHNYFIRNRYPEDRDVFDLWKAVPESGCPQDGLAPLSPDLKPEQRNVGLTVLLEQGHLVRDEDGTLRRAERSLHPSAISLERMHSRRNADYRRLAAMESYCNEPGCGRANLLRYLGETLPPDYRCGNCSQCAGERRITPVARPSTGARGRRSAQPRAAVPQGKGHTDRPFDRPRRAARARRTMPRTDAPGVFWTSAGRSFMTEELKARQVPRKIGLAILGIVAEYGGQVSPSGVANVLRGSRSSSVVETNPSLEQAPQFASVRGEEYGTLLQHVLAMAAKGYLAWSVENKRRLTLSPQGRKVLGQRAV